MGVVGTEVKALAWWGTVAATVIRMWVPLRACQHSQAWPLSTDLGVSPESLLV